MATKDPKAAILWLDVPEEHDYAAAASYLGLVIGDPDLIERLAAKLRVTPVTHYKAKDLLRASGLALLEESNKYVRNDIAKIRSGKKLSPILLVLGQLGEHPLLIADGYHRVCASYYLDEDTDIPAVGVTSRG
jgi:hypothetical protein